MKATVIVAACLGLAASTGLLAGAGQKGNGNAKTTQVNYPAKLMFLDRAEDGITSDGKGAYTNGVDGVTAVLQQQSDGTGSQFLLEFSTVKGKLPRSVTYQYTTPVATSCNPFPGEQSGRLDKRCGLRGLFESRNDVGRHRDRQAGRFSHQDRFVPLLRRDQARPHRTVLLRRPAGRHAHEPDDMDGDVGHDSGSDVPSTRPGHRSTRRTPRKSAASASWTTRVRSPATIACPSSRPSRASARRVVRRAASSPWCKSACIRRALHPAWRRCSSLKYTRYSRSSRLASRAHRPARCNGRLAPRAASERGARPARLGSRE